MQTFPLLAVLATVLSVVSTQRGGARRTPTAAKKAPGVVQKVPKGFRDSNPNVGIERNSYYVTFKGEVNTREGKSQQQKFVQQVKQQGLSVKVRRQFSTLVNAASFTALKQDLPQIAKLPYVKSVVPMLEHYPPRVIKRDVNNPALKYAHSITGVQEVHEDLKFTGKGIKVGIIDSGIDYKHSALGGCFGPGCKVAYGYDFVGDAYNGKNDPTPGGDVRDHCNGHGTHVAGIVAAKDKDFVGVAPDATLGAYRVFGCNGSTSNDIIISAMERAYIDNMDIINLSLGGGSSWPTYPDAIVADKLAEKGVLVSAAMGNDGDKGPWEASSPGVSTTGVGVASIDNIRYAANGFTVDKDKSSFDYVSAVEDFVFPLPSGTVVAGRNSTGTDLGCEAFPADTFKGKIALIQRGECTFNVKALNAQTAGAVGALFYNKEFGAFGPQISDANVTIPVAGLTQDSGRKLLAIIDADKSKSADVKFPKEKLIFDNPTGGKLSSFSSWGPGPGLEMKPDFAAPGGLVYSTYPLDMGGYATLSGTSMATPYVSGSAALFLQAKGKMNPIKVREILKQNSRPVTVSGTNDLTPVQQQGAGLINVKAAISSDTTVTPAMFPLLSKDAAVPRVQTITVRNSGKVPLRYKFSHKPALTVQPWEAKTGELSLRPITKNNYATVSFNRPGFALSPGESRDVEVTFQDPQGLDLKDNHLYGGYVVITPRPYGSGYPNPENLPTEISLPYSGMYGSYKSVSLFPRPESGLPALFDARRATAITRKDAKAVFTLKEEDIPYLIVRLIHPCRKIRVKVYDANKRELGLVAGADDENVGRNDNSEKNLSFPIAFKGFIQALGAVSEKAAAPAPDGDYTLRVEVLKPFGKEAVLADWQMWETPVFTLNRTLEPSDVFAGLENSTVSDRINKWLHVTPISKLPTIEGDSIADSVLPRPVRIVEMRS